MKILFLISSLRAGGAERVTSVLCNNWVANGHEVVLITFDSQQNDFYKSSHNIIRYSIGSYKCKSSLIKHMYVQFIRLYRTRRIILREKPDLVVSFMDSQNMLAILACLFTNIPVVISERTYPPYFNHNNLFDILRKRIYCLTDAFVAQTNEVANWAAEFINNKKISVIPNPLNNHSFKQPINQSLGKNIIAIGRLVKEKGFDMLIKAYQRVHAKYPDWKLLIIGEGSERKNLERQIEEMSLGEKIILTGQTSNLDQYYATSQIFVLSSRVEGFPNVLLESMAAGMAVVSFDCKSGPADLISNGVNGFLIEQNNTDHLSLAIERLIQDVELRQKISLEATKVREKYKPELIAEQWLDVFKHLIS